MRTKSCCKYDSRHSLQLRYMNERTNDARRRDGIGIPTVTEAVSEKLKNLQYSTVLKIGSQFQKIVCAAGRQLPNSQCDTAGILGHRNPSRIIYYSRWVFHVSRWAKKSFKMKEKNWFSCPSFLKATASYVVRKFRGG